MGALFHDRADAGRQLAPLLRRHAGRPDGLVLAGPEDSPHLGGHPFDRRFGAGPLLHEPDPIIEASSTVKATSATSGRSPLRT